MKNSTTHYLLDSLSNQKISLNFSQDKPINIYACGITPYSDSHIGHARSYVIFDLLSKFLKSQGYQVNLARNITDIDDKIINAAKEKNVSWQDLSDEYSQKARDLMHKTGLDIPMEPKASDYLPDIFSLIEKLLSLGHAYHVNGDVLYKVSSYKGKLLMNHQEGSLKSQNGQTRVDESLKEDARDFALWKKMPLDTPGFDSPWGWGRPGWHIECSAMIGALFDGSVDIHGGGVDLKFPHHQAEIMQSEPVWKKPLAKLWMHNGSVLSNGVKMSKSLKNYITWQDALNDAEKLQTGFGADIIKLSLLKTHWQKPLDWKKSILVESHQLLTIISSGFERNVEALDLEESKKHVADILSKNLNVPMLISELLKRKNSPDFNSFAQAVSSALNLKINAPIIANEKIMTDEIQTLIEERQKARDNQNWSLADEIRNKLKKLGYEKNDSPSNG